MSNERLNEYQYVHASFCVECGEYFTQEVDGGVLMVLKCKCVKERVYSAGQWHFIESVGHGIGMMCVMYGLIDFTKGEGTKMQRIDAFVLQHFGDKAECDKDRAQEVMRGLMANGRAAESKA